MVKFLNTLNVKPDEFKKAYNKHVRDLKKAEKKLEEKDLD